MNTRRVLAGLWAATMAPAIAGAAGDGFMPPAPEGGDVPWLATLYGLVFAGAVAAAAFKNSKRTHLD